MLRRFGIVFVIVSLLSGLVVVAASAGPVPVFGPAEGFQAAGNPNSVAIGDLNADGKPDLVVANQSGGVSLLTGDGHGSFSAPDDLPAGSLPQQAVIGDLNGDGKPDIAVADEGSNDVTVLLGDGAGSFTAATGSPFAVGRGPHAIAIGDFNEDGRPDLVTANDTSGDVSVLFGTGGGTFGAPTSIDVGSTPTPSSIPLSVAVGDLNGDGHADIVTANFNSTSVSVLLGNGDGTFAPKTDFTTGFAPHAVAIADLNGDGKPDLAVADQDGNSVSVMLGDGAGNFPSKSDFATDARPVSVAVGDMNGDGKPDLVTADITNHDVSILLGTGLGTFGAATNRTVDNSPTFVSVGDLDGDGRPDIAVANHNPVVAGVSVLLAAASATFAPPLTAPAGSAPTSLALGDFNADGKPDLVVSNQSSNNVSVLQGAGNGSFNAVANYTVGTEPESVAVGDVNGDGKPDIVTANPVPGTVSVLLGTGAGTFIAPASNFPAGTDPQGVAIGDVNGDGFPDLVVADAAPSGQVAVLLGTGAGSFGSPTPFAVGQFPQMVAIGDFNGDGKPDVAVPNDGSSNVSVLLGNGTPSLFNAANTFTVGSSPLSLAIGDLNGDGHQDIAAASDGATEVSVLLGTGTGSFASFTHFATATPPFAVALGDVNGDGIPDVEAADIGGDEVSVLVGTGSGMFEPHTDFTTGGGSHPNWVVTGDVNGDGKTDIATSDGGSSSASVLLDAGLPSAYTSSSSLSFGRLAAGSSSPLYHVVVQDGGEAVLHISDARIAGADASNFALVQDDCAGSSLAVTRACGVDVAFTPQSSGFHAAMLEIADDAFASPQAIPLSGFATLPVVNFISVPAAFSRDASPTFDFASDGPARLECNFNSGGFSPCTSPVTLSDLQDGPYTFAVEAIDRAGETGPIAQYSWTVDTTPPDVSITAPASKVKTRRRAARITLRFSAFDANISSTSCRLDAGSFAPCSPGQTYTVRTGRHTVSVRARDLAGNVTTVSKSFKVVKT